jgi:hypothetical protein
LACTFDEWEVSEIFQKKWIFSPIILEKRIQTCIIMESDKEEKLGLLKGKMARGGEDDFNNIFEFIGSFRDTIFYMAVSKATSV